MANVPRTAKRQPASTSAERLVPVAERFELRRLRIENADLVSQVDQLRRELGELRRLSPQVAPVVDYEAERRAWWLAGRRAGFWAGVGEGRRQAHAETERAV